MLKNHGPIRHVTLPLTARVLMVAALVASGLLVAGLRGPLGDSPAMAQEQPAAAGAAAAPGSYNLSFVPADARLIIAARPGNLLHRREIRSLLDSMLRGPVSADRLPVRPEEIEQAILFWGPDANLGGPRRGPGPEVPPSSVSTRPMTGPSWWPRRSCSAT